MAESDHAGALKNAREIAMNFAIQTTDTIEGSGYPLAFKYHQGAARTGLITGRAARDVIKVEARVMGGHQKEALITEGDAGSVWRVTSDEGVGLKGTDLAPFPLGYFNAALQADLINRIRSHAAAHGIPLAEVGTKLLNRYSFEGSFFKGTGRGLAEPTQIAVRLVSQAKPNMILKLVHAALLASPALAACSSSLENTFALYVNGRRRAVTQLRPSSATDATDPFKIYHGLPRPLENALDLPDLVGKASEPPPADGASPEVPAEAAKFEIHVGGRSRLIDGAGLTESETWLRKPAMSSRFRLKSDEREIANDQGPCGLGLQAAGIAFCFMTQLLRYVEHQKLNVRAIRAVQSSPYRLSGTAADWSLIGHADPVDTHLMVHGDESEDTMERLMKLAVDTCYLHATLAARLVPEIRVELNGTAIA